MLKYVEITNDNILFATGIQMEIFPSECAFLSYKNGIDKNAEYCKYYLVYEEGEIVGITGLYSTEDIADTNSIWLGWFGVLKEHRRQGKGRQILLDTIEMASNLAQKYPIKFFRLYTSEKDNPISLILYDKIMDLKEYYQNPDDVSYDGSCLIYSKGINGNKAEYWNNKTINLKGYIEEEKKGFEEYQKLRGLSR